MATSVYNGESLLGHGDKSSSGVAYVQAAVRNLEKVLEISAVDLAKRVRTLRGYADDLAQYCSPTKNPEAFRQCQAVTGSAVPGLLSLAQTSANSDMRITVLTALTCMSFDHLENASLVVTSELFLPMLNNAFRPITEIRQQEEMLSLLQLLQAICSVAPEAPTLVPVLPKVIALLAGTQEGHGGCDAVRVTALEVLVSCALSHQRRSQLATLLPESVLITLVNDAEAHGTAMKFPLGLILANLSDLFAQSPSGKEALSQVAFDATSLNFWEASGFFNDLRSCLEATLRSLQWPPQSGIHHSKWKLANTYFRLSQAGLHNSLHSAVLPLVTLVERRASDEAMLTCDDARAARSATAVLLELATDAFSLGQMRQSQTLPQALATMQSESLAAVDLLGLLETETAPFLNGSHSQMDYAANVAKPW